MIDSFRKIARMNRPGRCPRSIGLAFAILVCVCGLSAQVSPDVAKLFPERRSISFAEVAKTVGPAVVSIDTKGKVPEITTKNEGAGSDDIMDFFRRQLPRRPASAVGSGFIIDKQGYIITNAHVVSDAMRIVVRLDSGRELPAIVVGMDTQMDIAVLKVEPGVELPTVKMGDSNAALVGDWVLALGSPFGLARSVTAGIISQTQRETPYATPFQKFIQTDAAINRGNSGGPLVNMSGEVIGVNSQIATGTGDYSGVGFALPSNEVIEVYDQIVKFGKVRRGYLGVALESVKEEYAKVYGLPEPKGAIIVDVPDKQSPAGVAGLRAGDVIIEMNGRKVENAGELVARVAAASPEESANFQFLRENGKFLEKRSATIRLAYRKIGENPADDATIRKALPVGNTKEENKPFGLTLTELTPALSSAYELGGRKGLVVKEINPASFISDVKASNGADALDEGDLIQRINRTQVTDVRKFIAIVAELKAGDPVVLEILRYDRGVKAPQLRIVQFTVQ
ncbi:MAG: trypsin-like peptidase domain-containing protein [Pyrinomonadaceae bacterium]